MYETAPFSLSKNLFLTDWQRAKKRQRQATRPRSVYRYSRGESCAVSQNALRSKPFYPSSVKNQRFLPPSPQGGRLWGGHTVFSHVLTIWGFFDTLEGAVSNIRDSTFIYYNNIGCNCLPSAARASASGIFEKSATILVGFSLGSSCPKGTK